MGHSVRWRLTFWNVLILALVLAAFGAALCYQVQRTQSAFIDRDLAARVSGLTGRGHRVPWHHFGRPPRPPQPVGQPFPVGEPRLPRPGFEPRNGLQPPPFPGRPPDGPLPGEPGFARPPQPPGPRGFARPLLFDLQGRPTELNPDDRPFDMAGFRIAAGGRGYYSTVALNGEPLRVLSVPLRRDGRITGVAQIATPLAEQQRLWDSLVRTLLLLFPFALFVAGAAGLFLTNRALHPVSEVTDAAAQIGAEDLSRRLEVRGRDELAKLAMTFNAMIARLEEAFRRVDRSHRELEDAYRKLETAYQEQRRFTGDASHELRTPLTRLKGSTSLALSGPHDAAEYREALVVADEAADTMTRIVQDLLLLARSDAEQLPVTFRPVPVSEIFLKAVSSLPEQPGAPVHVEAPPDRLRVWGDSHYLARVLVNLLENALRHTPPEGRITVSADEAGETVRLSVADTGEGISPEHLPHVCERFYRVDASRTADTGGTGLGLAICRSIVEAHGGTLSIRSRPGEGTTVEVSLPSTGQ